MDSGIDRATGRYRWGTAAVIVLTAALYLLGDNRVGLWDRDEPRYAQTSKQMLQSRPADWIVPRLLDDVRTAKPILIYWCEAGAMAALGPTDFAARLPSGVAMVLVLGVLGVGIGRWLGAERAFWTVLILSCSGLAIAAAKMCITDSVLLLWVTITQMCLFAVYMRRAGTSTILVMWIAAGLAALTKGPVVIAVSGMTMVVLAALDVGRRWRKWGAWREAMGWWGRTRPLLGIGVLVVVCAPWLVLLQVKEPTFLSRAIGHEIISRATKPLEGHKGPPGYYWATLWGTYMPWSLLLPAIFVEAWRSRRRSYVRFTLAAAIGPWLLMECIQTKLAHYILPIFPALALLTADLLVRGVRGRHRELQQRLHMVPVSIWAGAVAVIGFGGFFAIHVFPAYREALLWPSIALAAVGVSWAGVTWWLWWKRALRGAMLSTAAGMFVAIGLMYAVLLPRAGFLWLPQHVAAELKRQGATHAGDVVMMDYQEDSLYWYQGGTIRQAYDQYYLTTPEQKWAPWGVLTERVWKMLPAATKERLRIVYEETGLAYADRMRVVKVVVVRAK